MTTTTTELEPLAFDNYAGQLANFSLEGLSGVKIEVKRDHAIIDPHEARKLACWLNRASAVILSNTPTTISARTNNMFIKTSCALCLNVDRPDFIMFVDPDGDYVCDECAEKNAPELVGAYDRLQNELAADVVGYQDDGIWEILNPDVDSRDLSTEQIEAAAEYVARINKEKTA